MATSSSFGTSPPHEHEADPLLEPGSFIHSQYETPTRDPETDLNDDDVAVPETPSWLPQGWKMELKVRGSGATAGHIDRYYVEPTSGCRLRSKKEVEYFLQTGTKRKKIIPPVDGAADVQPSESSGVGKTKKSSSGSKNTRPLDFDFENVPEMTSWKLKDASKDLWVPYIGDQMVSDSTKQGWDAAIQSLMSGTFKPM